MRKNNVDIPSCDIDVSSNARMKRISAYSKASGDKIALYHGKKRGVYYHDAVDPSKRNEIILEWYNRWGLPRYNQKKDQLPPYYDGLS